MKELNFSVNMDEFLPLRDVVFNTLRQAILRGELKPGERLMEIQLANKLGVSRTPIREAIRKLELEGLVLVIPRKGAEVADIKEKSLRDVLEVRKALEELSVQLACEKITKEEIEELKEAAETFKKAQKTKDITQIAEDRKGEGLLLLRSVKENIMITHNEKNQIINLKKETEQVAESIQNFEIKVPGQNASVSSLSGGNQQKTIIARCAIDYGNVYIFDEPTKGVDVGAKEEIYKHILKLAKEGKFVIIISSDMPELLSMSDRIGVMCEGELVDIVATKDTSEDELMKKYLGYN